jgi:hypothetical protein
MENAAERPPDSEKKPRWLTASRVLVGLVIAATGFFTGTVYKLLPNLVPITERTAEITIVTAEPSVTQDEFGQHTIVDRGKGTEFHCGQQQERPLSRPEGNELGFVIHFAFTVAGLRGDCVLTEYVLFDGATGRRLVIDRPQFQQDWSTDLREADAGSGEIWVSEKDLATLTTDAVVVRVELYNQASRRLTYLDSPRLCLPTLRACDDSGPSSR